MKEKSTSDLSQELMRDANIDHYIHENQSFFSDKSVSNLLSQLYEKKTMTKAALARKAGMSEIYLLQVFSGRRSRSHRRPSAVPVCSRRLISRSTAAYLSTTR